ncbi:MAG: hypothetical protein ACYC2H_06720 [Thermoplasmatota archaeon]
MSEAPPASRMARLDAAVLRVAEGKALATRTPFLWGLIEATFFVIIPDLAIGYAALYGWRRGLLATGWAILGAVLGGIIVFVAPGLWDDIIPRLPGITHAMVADAAARFDAGGWWAVVTAPTVGHPYKIYALLAAQEGRSLGMLLLVTPVARGWRFLAVAAITTGIGLVLRKPLRRHPTAMLGVYVAFWAVQYLVYFRYLSETY